MTSSAERKFSILNPNSLSALRGLIGFALPFLILTDSRMCHLWACGLFLFGAITDYWDGWLARQYKMESAFGKWVDPFTDKILILAPLAAFAALGFFSAWWLVPVFFREIVVTFCRTAWLLEGKSFGAEKLGKLKFVLQAVSVWLAFAILIFWDYPATEKVAKVLGPALVPVLAVTVLLTIVSGFFFLWNQKKHFGSQYFRKFVLATGVGLLPGMPGTWGSILGVLLVFLTGWNVTLYVALTAGLVFAGELAFRGLTDKSDEDPQFIVIDEVIGIFVTFLLIPISWPSVVFGFILFRLFDVWKPFPVRHLERIPGYWGIVVDDVGAGIYAWIILFLIFAMPA